MSKILKSPPAAANVTVAPMSFLGRTVTSGRSAGSHPDSETAPIVALLEVDGHGMVIAILNRSVPRGVAVAGTGAGCWVNGSLTLIEVDYLTPLHPPAVPCLPA